MLASQIFKFKPWIVPSLAVVILICLAIQWNFSQNSESNGFFLLKHFFAKEKENFAQRMAERKQNVGKICTNLPDIAKYRANGVFKTIHWDSILKTNFKRHFTTEYNNNTKRVSTRYLPLPDRLDSLNIVDRLDVLYCK